ncbi:MULTISPECIES: DUF1699 family protein [Thermococcus]|uniref:Uncharacterized protein conserved in archaea n=1 Tax=Thermococcus nautili TaxID=195522 RepID=W8P526_9EURY|nr:MULTISPECIES: DUF1699 family protein [Thermococcus]AHL22565.1 Uncharacterized protein conserved in archaea [Thermococcus nautili]NJE48172.1 DUF1699 domain-containing protein [Thermococcus sp. 9N3]CAI1493389.1 conserved protein of unknown function [Thermococcus nautili]
MKVRVSAKTYDELLRKLSELDEDVTEVYVSLRPTKEVVVKILENAPNVKRISCPPSLYPKVSKRVIYALGQLGIELVPENRPRGRPRKYDEKTVKLVRELARKGVPMREISERLGIPLRTVYYMVNELRA